MANEKYLTRPKTKPSETLKGKLNKWDNGYAEFVPQGQKPSNRSMLKQLGNSSFYKSEGSKESSYSLHLNVDGASQDPVAEMAELFLNFRDIFAEDRFRDPGQRQGAESFFADVPFDLQIFLVHLHHPGAVQSGFEETVAVQDIVAFGILHRQESGLDVRRIGVQIGVMDRGQITAAGK